MLDEKVVKTLPCKVANVVCFALGWIALVMFLIPVTLFILHTLSVNTDNNLLQVNSIMWHSAYNKEFVEGEVESTLIIDEVVPKNVQYVFIGDSRFVGMNNSVHLDEEYVCIAKVGAGYDWFNSTALPKLEEIVSADKTVDEWVLVLGLGVNDVHNVDKYIDIYEELSDDYTLYVTSVNPVGQGSQYVSNTDVCSFNERIQSEEFNYVDVYSYLQEVGYITTDGVHYDTGTYAKVYEYIIDNIK